MTHKKNKVSISVNNGMLRLRLPKYLFNKETYLYLGLENTERNRIIAEAKAKLIEYDLAFETFDFTLKKYTLRQKEEVKNLYNENSIKQIITEYIEFKKLVLSPSNRNISTFENWINKIDNALFLQPDKLTNYLLQNTTQEQARRLLERITAAIQWGVNLEKLDCNPFEKNAKIKSISNPRIDPFSIKERDLIIEAFKDNHYYWLVQFLFFTGCRPSEAIGLKWEKINLDYTSFLIDQAIIERKLSPHTKTHKIRHFPINCQLKNILFNIKKESEFIFLSKTRKLVDFHNFNEREWKPILKSLPIRYRPPYCCRHTFITLCLIKGIAITQVAYWVGNTPEIILRHYAGLIPTEVPVL
jgi:integrase